MAVLHRCVIQTDYCVRRLQSTAASSVEFENFRLQPPSPDHPCLIRVRTADSYGADLIGNGVLITAVPSKPAGGPWRPRPAATSSLAAKSPLEAEAVDLSGIEGNRWDVASF